MRSGLTRRTKPIRRIGLNGREVITIAGLAGGIKPRGTLAVAAVGEDGTAKGFTTQVRIDTPEELVAFSHGGILPYVARQLAARK